MRRLYKEVGRVAYRRARVSGDSQAAADDVRSDFTTTLMFAESGIRGVVPSGHRALELYWERRWLVRGAFIYVVGAFLAYAARIPAPENIESAVSLSGSVILGVFAGSGRMFRPDRRSTRMLYEGIRDLKRTERDIGDDLGRLLSYGEFVDSYVRVLTRTRGAKRAFSKGVLRERASNMGDVCKHQWAREALECDEATIEMALNLATDETEIGELIEGIKTLQRQRRT